MRIVDVNVLLYATNPSADRHAASRRWLDGALSGGSTVGFAWVALLGFVRLATKPGVLNEPATVDAAWDTVEGWLEAPSAVVVEPTARHASLVRGLLRDVGTGGDMVTDAHLAALAIEHRGVVVSFDHDFARFPGVRWERPG